MASPRREVGGGAENVECASEANRGLKQESGVSRLSRGVETGVGTDQWAAPPKDVLVDCDASSDEGT